MISRKIPKILKSLFTESTGLKKDGFMYSAASNESFTHEAARATCIQSITGLPIVSGELSFRAINRSLRATDKVFVDMHRWGDYRNRQFISGQGDDSQHD